MQAIQRYKLVRAAAQEAILAEKAVDRMGLKNPVTELDFEISGIAQDIGKCQSADDVSSLISTYFSTYFKGEFSTGDFSTSGSQIWKKLEELESQD